jgi:hypothetical protein
MLASSSGHQGNVELKVSQIDFSELACWGQLEVRWVGKLENSEERIKLKVCVMSEVCQDGPKRASRMILGVWADVWRPPLGPSWAYLGLSWALLGLFWGSRMVS